MPDAPSAAADPVWETIPHDVLCPLCEYNLRGLSEPRCPECGYRFDWDDVINPKTRVHPYLFEHHPNRNVRSFFRTLCGTLRPIKFWKSLSPSQPSRPGRLAIYWLLSSMFVFLFVLGEWIRATVLLWDYSALRYYSPYSMNSSPPATPFSFSHLFDTAMLAWNQDTDLKIILYLALFWLVWPWFTLLTSLLYRVSIRRANIKVSHIDRCLVYSFDIGAWIGLVLGTAWVLLIWFDWMDFTTSRQLMYSLMGAIVVLITIRLWLAYKYYLRFDHAFWVVLASQMMVFLFLVNLVLLWFHVTDPPMPGDLFY